MIAGHIEDLITAAKALPNSLNRNKIISHLEDARAHAQVLELDYKGDYKHAPARASVATCTCPQYPYAQDFNCPVHKAG